MPRAAINKENGLTEKQEKFALAYFRCGNASEAYREVYSTKNAKPESVNRNAKALIDNIKIASRVAELRNASAERAEIDDAELLREAKRLALSDIRGLFNPDGSVKPPQDWPDAVAAAVASIEVFEEFGERNENGDRALIGHTKKLKFWDKNSALERLFKHRGLFEKDHDQLGRAISKAIIVPAKG